jgi:hypothetical protein
MTGDLINRIQLSVFIQKYSFSKKNGARWEKYNKDLSRSPAKKKALHC